jgi:hypothetical protein
MVMLHRHHPLARTSDQAAWVSFGKQKWVSSRERRSAGAYDMAELRVLASDINVDWEEIRGDTKSERIVELIAYLKRRSRLTELIAIVKIDRAELLQTFEP